MLLYKSSLNYLKRNFLQSLFVIVGISLGIAVTFAIDIAVDSAQKSFSLSAKRVAGVATHSIYSIDGKEIEEKLFVRLKNDLGIADLAPVLEAFVPVFKSSFVNNSSLEKEISLTQKNADRDLIKILGIDPLSESKFREIQIAAKSNGKIFSSELGVFCSKTTAKALGVELGDKIRLRIGSKIKEARLQAFFDSDSSNYQNLFLMDISQAQKLLDKPGKLTRIDLKAIDDSFNTVFGKGISLDELKKSLSEDETIKSSESRSKSLEQMTKSFNINLQALSFLAIIVAAFLIYNSVSFSVVQRRKIYAVYRTIGVSRREIIKAVVLEAFVFAILGIGLGVFLGYLFADTLVGLVLQTINDIYFSVEVSVKAISFFALFKSVGLGLLMSLVAALLPALDASSTNPVMAMSRTSFESKNKLKAQAYIVLSVCFAILAYFVVKIKVPDNPLNMIFNDINFGFLALLFILLSFTLLIPTAIQILCKLLEPIYAFLLGFAGSFSIKSIARQLSRTSVAISALTIALSMTLALNITVSSFRQTVENWLEQSLKADVYISVPRLVSNQANDVIPEEVQFIIDKDFKADVQETLTYSMLNAESNIGEIQLAAIQESEAALGLVNFHNSIENFWQRMISGEKLILVSEPFTYKNHLGLNDSLEIKTKQGLESFTIAGIFEDFGSEHGIVMMSKKTFQYYFKTKDVNSLGVILRDHNSKKAIDGFIEKLKSAIFKKHLLFIRSNYSLKQESMDIFDRTFQVTNVLKFIALAVAFIAILSSFMSLQLERIKEFSILRATGTSPWQIGKILSAQTLTMGFFAFLFAIPAGIIQAYVMIFIINKRSFGWSLSWNLESAFYIEVFLLAMGASIISVIYPIFFTNRVNLSESLRND
jgi:putative ABC transport system permease protein